MVFCLSSQYVPVETEDAKWALTVIRVASAEA